MSIDAMFGQLCDRIEATVIAKMTAMIDAVQARIIERQYMPLGPWWTQEQAAEYANFSTRTIRDATNAGRLQCGGHGAKPVYCAKWLDEWLASRDGDADTTEPTPLHPQRGRAA